MKIIEYDEKYIEDVKNLLVELQEYIIEIDNLETQIIADNYRDKYYEQMMVKINKSNGKMYIAVLDNHAVGLVVGTIAELDEVSILTIDKSILKGQIDELIISKKIRGKGIGSMLINKIEEYFKNIGCKYIFIEVFGPNIKAKQFYFNNNYEITNYEVGKKIQ